MYGEENYERLKRGQKIEDERRRKLQQREGKAKKTEVEGDDKEKEDD